MASQMVAEKGAAGGWQDSKTWQDLSGGGLPAEQIAYITALVLGAPLVHCDRPKDITFRRLWALPSVEDLDIEFGRRTTASYLAALPADHRPPLQPEPSTMSDRIIMMEREAVMCSIFETWAVKIEEGKALSQSPNPKGPLVAIVGAAHLPGLQQLWADGSWQKLAGDMSAREEVMEAPPLDPPPAGDLGVRRALVERLLRMCAPAEVLVELQKTLGQVEESQAEAYRNTRELYASCRMLLAMLPPEVLPVVCGELECRMWEVLTPCRGVRPSLGGSGWSDELVLDLRSLYVDVT